ncbi:MAG: hypothetical protein FWC10_05485 [Lentimicrobiaceae bacterium]|nr:hypothetical protein [Lentimicrobiaceae bacterium]
MKKLFPLILFILSFFLFVSCSKSIIFDEKIEFPNANWAFENKAITFEAPIKSSEKPFAIFLELEITGHPNVDKFYATFRITTPKGGTTVKSIFFNLANPQEPYRQGASQNEKIYKLLAYPKRYFSETGNYTFEVNQFSNKADNYGIRALRIYVEKQKE